MKLYKEDKKRSIIFFFLIDKKMYIKRKEEAVKAVPSEYTGSIQKKPKGSNRRGRDRNKKHHLSLLRA